jgi:hypothetical protein
MDQTPATPELDYEALIAQFSAVPITWIPGLLVELTAAGYVRDVFQAGGAASIVRKVERKLGRTAPERPPTDILAIQQDGGIIQAVYTDVPVRVVIVDHDTDGALLEHDTALYENGGELHWAASIPTDPLRELAPDCAVMAGVAHALSQDENEPHVNSESLDRDARAADRAADI